MRRQNHSQLNASRFSNSRDGVSFGKNDRLSRNRSKKDRGSAGKVAPVEVGFGGHLPVYFTHDDNSTTSPQTELIAGNSSSFTTDEFDFRVDMDKALEAPHEIPQQQILKPQLRTSISEENLNVPTWGGQDPLAITEAKYGELSTQAVQIVSKLKEARTTIQELDKEKVTLQKEKATLQRDLDDAQQDCKDLEQQLEDAFQIAGNNAGSSNTNVRFSRAGRHLNSSYEHEERRRREEDSRAILEEEEDDMDDFEVLGGVSVNTFTELLRAWEDFLGKTTPFAADIQHIQAQYGAGVAAFFKFCRWILMQFLILTVFSLLFLVVHFTTTASRSSTTALSLLNFNVEKYGIFPQVFAFSSHTPSEAVLYASILWIYSFCIVFHTLIKWRSEDRESEIAKSTEKEQKSLKFSKAFLAAWDNGAHSKLDANDLQRNLHERAKQMFAEKQILDRLRKRTNLEKFGLFLRRFLGLLLYLCFQALSWAVIIALTAGMMPTVPGMPESFSSVLVPAVVTLINTITPMFVTLVTQLEAWDRPETKIRMLIFRMYLAKVLNAAIQVLSVHLLADPFAFSNILPATTRYDVEKRFLPDSYTCRADMAWFSLYQLVIVEFLLGKAVDAGVPLVLMAVAAVLRKPFKRSEYRLEVKMVSALYFQALVFAVLPYGPSLVPIFAFFIYLNFKWARFELNHFLSKPAPFDVRSVAKFFVELYFLTVVLLYLLPLNFFFQSMSFPKSCELFDENLKLCEDEVIDGICTLKSASDGASSSSSNLGNLAVLDEFINNYVDEKYYSASGTENKLDYPWVFCKGPAATYDCGPFAKVGKPYETIRDILSSPPGGSIAYRFASQEAIILWAIIFGLFFGLVLRQNRISNIERVAEDRARNYNNEMNILQFKYNKSQKEVEKYKKASNLTNKS